MLPCVWSVKDHTEMTLKFSKTKKVLREAQWSVSLLFLPHFEAFRTGFSIEGGTRRLIVALLWDL